MSTNKWPPIDPGTRVMTTQPNLKIRDEWTDEGWASKKWGVRGTIIAHHDSHGLFYNVRHDDGTKGYYDPSELEIVEEGEGVNLNELQQETEKLLSLLKDRQSEPIAWSEFLYKQLHTLHALTSQALGK
ncbi:MAG: hypothetical protein HYX22_02705 [Candidatus Yanofskybacteria bacterium]|nr:hypothetical protein [Candidatus Yanofskybacteria bacterium]